MAKPEGMTLWLKMDSKRLGIDSSCARHVKIHGHPIKIPAMTGYYQPVEKSNLNSVIIEETKAKRYIL